MTKDRRRALDYLVIGHLSEDRGAGKRSLGGTAAYAGMAARALGCRVRVLTAAAPDLDLGELAEALEVRRRPSPRTTTLETLPGTRLRRQRLIARAADLRAADLPPAWRRPRIVHFAPIADEVDPELIESFPPGVLRGLTAQGWLRCWDEPEKIFRNRPWRHLEPLLGAFDAVVLSLEDLGGDLSAAPPMAGRCRVLAVTAGAGDTRVFSGGRERRFTPPRVREIDPTGAGDVFAAAFFVHLAETGDPWRAAPFANRLAAASTTRSELASAPTPADVAAARRLARTAGPHDRAATTHPAKAR